MAFDKEERAHQGVITDLQMSPDGTYFITSSKDKSAKVRPASPSCILRYLARLWASADGSGFFPHRSGPLARTRTRTARRSS